MAMANVVDAVLDRTVVLGYSRVGSALRRSWWPADPPACSMSGGRVLVTGATSGIGEAMARSFADLGAVVHLLGRDADKVRTAAAELRSHSSVVEVVEEVCDVGDLDAVRTWAADFTGRVPELHGLVHNAGTMTEGRQETRQGHEVTLAVHVLGPHLMTELLRQPLTNASGASVVWMSSGGMYGSPLVGEPEDIEYRRGEFKPVQAYARTKRMQVVLADAWSRRLGTEEVKVESMHPGWVETPGVATHLPTFNMISRPVLRDAEDGADTAVWLVATRPESEAPHFWHDRAQRPTRFGWQREADPAVVRRFLAYVAHATGTPDTWG